MGYQADGLSMMGRLFHGSRERTGAIGILVFPDAFGLGEHGLHQAERLASLGHVVLACDLHGNGARLDGVESVLRFVAEARREPSGLRARARGALDAILQVPGVSPSKIVTVGYCLGGTMGLELARSGAPIAATIGLHCGLGTARPEDARNILGEVLVCIGADDPVVPAEERVLFEKEMREGDVDWELVLYGGVVHSFTDRTVDRLGQPHITRYSSRADQRSWLAIQALLDQVAED
jgi:dienelactone hydrolase